MQKLIIAKTEKGLLTVLTENGKALRLHLASGQESADVGDIFRARIQKVSKGLGSAFVMLGDGLHAYMNTGRRSTLKAGEELTVQVTQEAMGLKLPSVSSSVSLPGISLVLTDRPAFLGFSRRGSYDPAKREAVKALLQPWLNEFGFIVRTAAESASEEELQKEAASLAEEYRRLAVKAEHAPAPSLVRKGRSAWMEWAEGMEREAFEAVTDDPASYEEMRAFFAERNLSDRQLRFYDDSRISLEKLFSLEKILSEAAGRKVWLPSGAYLIIDHTEAMTVVDVNSGKNESPAGNAAEKINREAATELARQLVLRNISGMILVDFIGMKREGAEGELLAYMREAVRSDPVFTQVIDITPLGLMELTRRRIRRPLRYTI